MTDALYARSMHHKQPNEQRTWPHRSLLAACAFLFLCASGCQWKGNSPAQWIVEAVDVWNIRPVKVRIYPSSRLNQDDAQALLEARIELLDDMGDSIKAAGKVQLELLAAGDASQSMVGRRLYTWNVSILTLEQQKQHYDPITRSYLFRLKMDHLPDQPQGCVLQVSFVTADGQRMETQSTLGD